MALDRRFLTVTTGIALVILFSCSRSAENATEEPAAVASGTIVLTRQQVNSAGITFGRITPEMLSMDIHAKGKLILHPQNLAQVSSVVSGSIEEILVQEGSVVVKGAPLLSVISPEFIRLQQDFLEVRSNFRMKEQDYKRQELLVRDRIISEKKFQEITAEYEEIKARYASLKAQLNLLNISAETIRDGDLQRSVRILAPIGGSVEKIQVHLGRYIEPQVPLMILVDKSSLVVELMVFEKDIPYVSTGQRVTFKLANLSGEIYEAKVAAIGRTVEENARTVRVLAHFINKSPAILPGMFVAAEIHTSEQTVDALPEEAVITDEANPYIFITPDQDQSANFHFIRIPVQTGFREDGFIQVTPLKAIPAGMRIPVKGTFFIKAQGLKQAE